MDDASMRTDICSPRGHWRVPDVKAFGSPEPAVVFNYARPLDRFSGSDAGPVRLEARSRLSL